MADPKDSGLGLATNGLVLLIVAATTGTLFFRSELPLQGSRPATEVSAIRDNSDTNSVDARLWQDPFAAVSKHLAAASPFAAELVWLVSGIESKPVCTREQPRSHRCSPLWTVPPKSLVVGVTVPGGPYPEAAEARERYRYAVLAALDVEHYVPKDGEHIDYFLPHSTGATSTEPTGANTQKAAAPLPAFIPFEQFVSAKATARKPEPEILVLWIDEDAISRDNAPIANLLELARELSLPPEPSPSEAPSATTEQPAANLAKPASLTTGGSGTSEQPGAKSDISKSYTNISIIGPSNSTMLSVMIDELIKPNDPGIPDNRCRNPQLHCPLEFFDYGATLSDTAVRQKLRDLPIASYLENNGIRFHRMIASDDVVANAIASELSRRDVCPTATDGSKVYADCVGAKTSPGRVAIVSEWDTSYGQSLPETMGRAFCSYCSSGAAESLVERFSYLRGLDGQLPDEGANRDGRSADRPERDQGNSKKKEDDTSSDMAKRLDRPVGQGQFDYLQRLADRMKQTDRELDRSGNGHIMAIGVLGSDVYDKLLVLRALRPDFPGAIFFTTDIDARFSDPGEIPATRNLLIASSFDLQLRQARQGDIPPFRDDYQTAAFLSTQVAVTRGIEDCATRDCTIPNWHGVARLFQIGRTGAFAFPVSGVAFSDDARGDRDKCEKRVLDCRDIHPAVGRLYPELSSSVVTRAAEALLLGLSAAVLAFAWVAFVGRFESKRRVAGGAPASDDARGAPGFSRQAIGTYAILAIAAALLGAYWNSIGNVLTSWGKGEPMLLFAGISVWPVIALRLASVVLCLALIFRAFNRLDKNLDEIGKRLRLGERRQKIIDEQDAADLTRSCWAKRRDTFSLSIGKRPRHPAETPKEAQVIDFWRTYVCRGRIGDRVWRASACVLLMLGFSFVLLPIFGGPNDPARDGATRAVYIAVTTLDFLATQFLIFLVADATLFSCQLVRALRKASRSVWPKESEEAYQAQHGVEEAAADEWLNLTFVAMRTSCIMRLIYYPFIMIALLIVSRSTVFDNFAASGTILISHAVSLAVVAGCVVWLRVEAEQSRKTTKAKLDEMLTNALIAAKTDDEKRPQPSRPGPHQERAAHLRGLVEKVDALQEGAFSPFSQQPLVKAVLVPLTTYGGTYLVEHLTGS
jgi:hypothetical protein